MPIHSRPVIIKPVIKWSISYQDPNQYDWKPSSSFFFFFLSLLFFFFVILFSPLSDTNASSAYPSTLACINQTVSKIDQVKNQHTRELISARKTSLKHKNKHLSRLR